jgi:DNA-directed RNA polymerase specialized sigma24 family protein
MAIGKLADPIRTIVALRLEGWKMKEIAAKLGISYWKANRALNRGIALLQKMF